MKNATMNKKIKKKRIKRIAITIIVFFTIAINAVAYFHAYKFTHFDTSKKTKTNKPEDLSTSEKIATLIFGISNPKPQNKSIPKRKYETIKLESNTTIECWEIQHDNPKGTVALFHGFSGEKSSMLDKADIFLNIGYNVLLVDFMGSGGSGGNQTTVGFKEAYDVKVCVDYLSIKDDKIILFGTSMGAVAIMKALNDYTLPIHAIIIECPFGTMRETVKSRFKQMNVPSFPMADLLIFWGGVQNGYNAFKHNPIDYSRNIDCPTLLLYGEKDIKVSSREIDSIFGNLNCPKELKTYKNSGHDNYLTEHRTDWERDITGFLLKY